MKISLHWPLPFLDPLLQPLSSDQSGKARAVTVPSHTEGRPGTTQQESRTAARTGSVDKLYLVNSVCFCFILICIPLGEACTQMPLKACGIVTPKGEGQPEYILKPAMVCTRCVDQAADLPNGDQNPESHPNLNWDPNTLLSCFGVFFCVCVFLPPCKIQVSILFLMHCKTQGFYYE